MNQPRLYISLQTDVSILSDFCCGQTNMDNFIHTRLGAFLKSYPTTRLFVVKDESHAIVAITPQYSAVPFYQKCNFCAAEIKNPYSDTLRMYRAFD